MSRLGTGRLFNRRSPVSFESQPGRHHFPLPAGHHLGIPERILCDNGPPWSAPRGENRWTALSVWLLKLGIGVGHGRALHPQTQGKDERFHLTLGVEVIGRQVWADLPACQRRFDPWRQIYNHERPHESLDMA